MTTLVVDGDLLLYRATSAVQKEVPVGDHRILMANFNDAVGVLEGFVADLSAGEDVSDIVFALSSPNGFRAELYPNYKGNRVGSMKPLGYSDLAEYVRDSFEVLEQPRIEADDIMGIYASRPGFAIWTLDKDLKQIPGKHLIDYEMVEVSQEEGDWWHYYQTLVGDLTDGYGGCPQVGDKIARAFLDQPYTVGLVGRKLKTGKNAGQVQERWETAPTDDIWAGIVSLYEKAGLTEEDALVQARLARILRDGDYDFQTKEIKLWTPHM